MTVVHSTLLHVTPGRRDDTLAAVEAARHYHQQYGFAVRVWQASVAGGGTGTILYALHSNGVAEHFDRMEALGRDPTWMSWWSAVHDAAAPPFTVASALLWASEPGLPWAPVTPPAGTPRAMMSTLIAPMSHGQRTTLIPALPELVDLVGRTGLVVRVAEAFVAGNTTGALAVSVEGPSLGVLGAAVEWLRTDTTYRALTLRLRSSAHAPRVSTRALYVELI